MKLMTLIYGEPVSPEEAEKRLMAAITALPGRPEYIAATHGKERPHHHVLIHGAGAQALAGRWQGKVVIHEAAESWRVVEYFRGMRLSGFYIKAFMEGGPPAEPFDPENPYGHSRQMLEALLDKADKMGLFDWMEMLQKSTEGEMRLALERALADAIRQGLWLLRKAERDGLGRNPEPSPK